MRSDLMLAIHYLEDVPGVDKAVLMALAVFTNRKTGLCRPSLPKLAKRTGFGRAAVSRAIQRLTDRELIEVKRTGRKHDFVILVRPRFIGARHHAPIPQVSPSETADVSEGDIRYLPESTQVSDKTGGFDPEVISEVVTEIATEVMQPVAVNRAHRPAAASENEHQLGPKVDALLDESPELFVREGEPRISLLASTIWQRDRYSGVPSERFVDAVRRCVAARHQHQQRRRPA